MNAYKGIITANTATTITVARNNDIFADATGDVHAVILCNPKAVDPGTIGIELPSDCVRPLYLSDNATPSSEKRIEIIQIDDTEFYQKNPYWISIASTAVQVGNTIHLLRGESASFYTSVYLTYVYRSVDYSSDTDEMRVTEGRLPEEFWEVMRLYVMRLAAVHLHRRDEAAELDRSMMEKIEGIRYMFDRKQEDIRGGDNIEENAGSS